MKYERVIKHISNIYFRFIYYLLINSVTTKVRNEQKNRRRRHNGLQETLYNNKNNNQYLSFIIISISPVAKIINLLAQRLKHCNNITRNEIKLKAT